MTLFDKEAHDLGTRAKRYGEPRFEYYNHSSRPAIGQIREVLENWFSGYPDLGKSDLRGRFKSNDDRSHDGAFFELYLHEVLRKLGYEVQVHPLVDKPTHPDFVVERNGTPAVLPGSYYFCVI